MSIYVSYIKSVWTSTITTTTDVHKALNTHACAPSGIFFIRFPKEHILHAIKSRLASPIVSTSLEHQSEIQMLWGEVSHNDDGSGL